jgi:Tfp pilus assembly protein PilN
MLQQINLYQDILLKEEQSSALRPLVVAFLGGMALLLVISGWFFWQSVSLRQQLTTLQSEQAGLVTHLAELAILYPPKVKSQLLEQEVANLMLARDARGPLMELLKSESQKNTSGFSPIMESLARQNPPGVWLRRVVIAAGGHNLLLEGSTQNPQLAPRYLQQLGKEPILSGIEFEALQMERSLEDSGTIDFIMQTTVEEKK